MTITTRRPAALTRRNQLALLKVNEHRQRVAEYEAECRDESRQGYRPSHCIHGMYLWVDYDVICWQCEDGIFTRWVYGAELYRQALDWADGQVASLEKRLSPLTTAATALWAAGFGEDAGRLIDRWLIEMNLGYQALGLEF